MLKAFLRFAAIMSIAVPCVAAATPMETILYRFKGGTDGELAMGSLLMGGGGALYGTTFDGGTPGGYYHMGLGTIFRMAPPVGGGAWTHRVIAPFGGEGGTNPTVGVVMDQHGNLYGTTMRGGFYKVGAVFQATPPKAGQSAWSNTTLTSFLASSDSVFPDAPLAIDENNVVYGTTTGSTSSDEGIVFSVTAGGGQTIIHRFNYESSTTDEGANPHGGVIIGADGALYGTTYRGGVPVNNQLLGTVYKLTPPASGSGEWPEQILYNFTGGADGSNPSGELVADKTGALYGTTVHGGVGSYGIVYKLVPPTTSGGAWTEKVLYRFKGGADGAYPETALLRTASGVLYGTTSAGGTAKLGTVFMLTQPKAGTAWTHTVLHSFTGSGDGALPEGGLIMDASGALYGSTSAGGDITNCSRGCGTVYKIVP